MNSWTGYSPTSCGVQVQSPPEKWSLEEVWEPCDAAMGSWGRWSPAPATLGAKGGSMIDGVFGRLVEQRWCPILEGSAMARASQLDFGD